MKLTEKVIEEMLLATGLAQLAPDLVVAIFDTFGNDIMTVAVSKFLETQGEWEQTAFENWITEHEQDDDMLAHLVTLYPVFGTILMEEIMSFSSALTKDESVSQ